MNGLSLGQHKKKTMGIRQTKDVCSHYQICPSRAAYLIVLVVGPYSIVLVVGPYLIVSAVGPYSIVLVRLLI